MTSFIGGWIASVHNVLIHQREFIEDVVSEKSDRIKERTMVEIEGGRRKYSASPQMYSLRGPDIARDREQWPVLRLTTYTSLLNGTTLMSLSHLGQANRLWVQI